MITNILWILLVLMSVLVTIGVIVLVDKYNKLKREHQELKRTYIKLNIEHQQNVNAIANIAKVASVGATLYEDIYVLSIPQTTPALVNYVKALPEELFSLEKKLAAYLKLTK